ncbi:unnamed protein product (macronuclear) [Paramecium tetraurelia]|uniref:Transmembrane protein n=1 Tax=Paramecium tetraurelia TaxID=5888 RepID=A0DRL6_PARTE|nr:uncharacterized protein GSPATT00019401001 [Paramecium tetraurelia]CAK85683.1 unnamed protein product [Paramecium tetraurelia]|eukprot:XP_001453080.1 hypothetical protein (macronuclear) [Paramecium tetraurelia strain d4-2]
MRIIILQINLLASLWNSVSNYSQPIGQLLISFLSHIHENNDLLHLLKIIQDAKCQCQYLEFYFLIFLYYKPKEIEFGDKVILKSIEKRYSIQISWNVALLELYLQHSNHFLQVSNKSQLFSGLAQVFLVHHLIWSDLTCINKGINIFIRYTICQEDNYINIQNCELNYEEEQRIRENKTQFKFGKAKDEYFPSKTEQDIMRWLIYLEQLFLKQLCIIAVLFTGIIFGQSVSILLAINLLINSIIIFQSILPGTVVKPRLNIILGFL